MASLAGCGTKIWSRSPYSVGLRTCARWRACEAIPVLVSHTESTIWGEMNQRQRNHSS